MTDSETATIADADVGEAADTILLGTRIPAELNEKLNNAAARLNLSKAAVARMAMDQGIDWVLERLGK